MSIKVVAGKFLNLGDDKLVCRDEETGRSFVARVAGHHIYVQKCIRPDIENGIALPEKSMTDHPEGTADATMCQVLAIGAKAGTPKVLTAAQEKWCDRDEQYREMMTSAVIDFKVMDKVMIKDCYAHPEAIVNSPYARDEFFVLDSLPFAKVEE